MRFIFLFAALTACLSDVSVCGIVGIPCLKMKKEHNVENAQNIELCASANHETKRSSMDYYKKY